VRAPFFRVKDWLFWSGVGAYRRAAATAVRLGRRRRFELDGRTYPYFVHTYNTTWRNERAVEIPLARERLGQRPAARVLEIGNVLGHYGHRGHDVVDKYEQGPGVVNVDVLSFRAPVPYDLIVAISTLEHVGLDEEDQDPEKPLRAVEHLRTLLASGGELFVTMPLGANPAVDAALANGTFDFDRVAFLRRISADNRWVQADYEDVAGTRYGAPYQQGNAIAVCVASR
jgi:hypothetical protein